MDLSDSDRPVSFSSTSSSASSRDSHCSFGSRMTLVSNSHLGLFNQDKETGAIKLELVPTRRFSSNKPHKDSLAEPEDPEESLEKRLSMPRKAEPKGASKNCAMSLVTEPTSPKLLYVDRVVQEILETERMYVQDLKSIVKDYLDCITDQTKLSLGTEERSALFGNIRDIYNFNRSVAVLTECMRNKALGKFFRERQEVLQHSLPLGSYLLKPVQRILKYHLLLHEIENHLDKDTEGYDVVLDAIDTMQRVAWHINDMKRKHEHAIRLQEIQSLLTNWKGPDLTSYGELVLEGTFRIQRAKNERTLFLFDKLLLITKKRDEMFVYKAHIMCGNLMLVEVIPKEPLSFSVFHYKNPKMQHTVQAKSQQEKRIWILHLKRLILENHPAKIPAKAKQAILEMDAIHHPGFHYSPEGEMKSSYQPKEGTTPHRVRRKSEPSSRVHKVLKSNDVSPDMQKVSREENSRQPQSLRQFNTPQSNSLIMNILGGSTSVRNIWTDHQIRQALFPSRRPPHENEDDEDDYQMFVPSGSTSNTSSAVGGERRGSSGRPCSWHLGVVHQNETSSPTRHKIVRRASSAGESNMCPASTRHKTGERGFRRDAKRAEVSGMNAYPESSEELTIDDIEHVYDNISYEDLKLMGLTRREETDHGPQTSARDTLYEAENKSCLDSPSKKRTANQNRASIRASREEILLSREAPTSSLDELRIVEDSIYDTIVLPETPLLNFKCEPLKCSKRRSFLGLEKNFACCDNLRQFVSEESLQFSEDESPYHHVPTDNDYLSLVDSSSNSDSLSHKSAADKLSEEVDEIWNDLENYIKKNEEKTRDRLLAAFPVCKDDMQDRLHAGSTPELSKDVEYSLSTLSLPETPIFPNTLKPRAATISEANLRLEDNTPCKENSFMSLNRSSFSCEMPLVDSPHEPANSVLSNAHGEGIENDLAVVDKTKNRVFMMARQYSQKIKKANQLLKVKSPDQEQPTNRQQKLKHKDLAAILEEKKQGGPAIGARIAEYSQLYDQIVFRESTPKVQKEAWATPQESPAGRFSTSVAASPPGSKSASEGSRAEDWLLNSTYSNGELADFSPWSESQDPNSKSSYTEGGIKSHSRQLPAAGSVPSLQISNRLHVPAQRWSAIISQPNKENLHQDHIYNSLGRRVSNVKPQAYSRSQSSSSIVVNRSGESIVYPNEMDKRKLHSNRNFRFNTLQKPGIAPGCTGTDMRKQIPENCSDVTLQDSQKVLKVNRASPLTAQMATQNYFSNFKDTEEGEGDDDDYVEIKSEDEGSDLETSENQTRKSDPKLCNADTVPSEMLCSKTVSCTPAKSTGSKQALTPYLTAYSDSDKLNDYLWRVPSPNQQNIVQSLREKFQCLSSSSFA
ncbi:pleckstrin homology domain-containing family G member 1 isoform X5 [Indicator indicator]|uniref:pleckstrin homology domain-containing family G member 1 isoform X5 n=1 Tax=Indicator indicator TaxID=1002788 RepID=UPI0023DEB7CF|nr:pleckstrin homology domain-containing family G member 1 isoform X5 [Indicator indicator]